MISTKHVIERILQHVSIPSRPDTVDGLIAGNLDADVTGISTTMMATLDVLRQSAAMGHNLIITHEPTFYLHQERRDSLPDDSVSQYKQAFIRTHNLNIFHFHDHWHDRQPDGIEIGMINALGWAQYADTRQLNLFHFPEMTLASFARELALQLGIQTMRVVGDPNLPVRRVLASWGFLSRDDGMHLLAQPDVDVLVAGETHEWEVVEYAQDMIAMGQRKALIILGHMLSEQGGMAYCAEWLTSFIPEVPIAYIPLKEPYWNPRDVS